MKKQIDLVFMILFVGFLAEASVSNCEAPVLSKISSVGFNTVVQYYPAGNCDFLGIASSTMQCRDNAEKQDYTCYQIANREFHGTYVVTTPYCFACLK